jgi:hypothetical protein
MSQRTERKPSLIALVAVLMVSMMLALPASASFDRHFTVVENKTKIINSPRAKFRDKAILVDAPTRTRRVGRLWAVCRFIVGGERCRYRFRLNGRVGSFGSITAKGTLAPHDRHIRVRTGTHDFKGVTGKVFVSRKTKKIDFDLKR